MFRRFFMKVLAFCFPWLIILMDDNPGGALLALIMQCSIIGWIPATVWAFRVLSDKVPQSRVPRRR